MRGAPRHLLAVMLLVGLVTPACADGTAAPDTVAGAPMAPAVPTGDMTVFAASSLTDVFGELGDAFTAANPDVAIRFSFAGSSDLVAQIGEGSPADVFASADLDNMAKLTDAGRSASEPVVFTTNRAAIIVEPGNPEEIAGIADLAREDVVVISCAPEVPCGRYAQQILDRAGVTVTFRSYEENARAVVSKVVLGEADAGIVYVTDVTSAGDDAESVEIPSDVNVTAAYPIAVTTDARNPVAAQAFVDFVMSDQGQAILASYGFVAP